MTKEQLYLIGVLSDHVNERVSIPVAMDLDWKMVAELSNKHQISGIIYAQCKNFIPDDVKGFFHNSYLSTIYLSINREEVMNKVNKELRKNDIQMITVKGSNIAKYYPVPLLRTMSDVDMVVHSGERQKTAEVLENLGFINSSHRDDKDWIFSYHNQGYELHDRLIYNKEVNNSSIIRFFNDFWPYVNSGMLDVSFHFLFLFEHLRVHFMVFGVGFRQFMDIALMCKKETKLNWQWIETKLRELDMFEFASICFSFIYRWFGIDSPFAKEELDDDFYITATEAIFNNGIFGYDNEKNQYNAAINAARQSKRKTEGMMRRSVSYIFPSYQMMLDQEFYPYLDGRPYLLPFAWIHRFIRGIHYSNRAKYKMSLYFSPKEKKKKRDDYLKRWGL